MDAGVWLWRALNASDVGSNSAWTKPAAERDERFQVGGRDAARMHHHAIGPRACERDRAHQRRGAHGVVGIGDERHIGVGGGR
jgi:hypothetical protein